MKRYFTRKLVNNLFNYYVVDGNLVRVYYKSEKDWRYSTFSLKDFLIKRQEGTEDKVVEYPIEEFVLLCPYPLPNL